MRLGSRAAVGAAPPLAATVFEDLSALGHVRLPGRRLVPPSVTAPRIERARGVHSRVHLPFARAQEGDGGPLTSRRPKTERFAEASTARYRSCCCA